MNLVARHARFVEEYLVDLNATEAFVRSGGRARGKAANVTACRWMAREDVQEAIKAGMAERSKRTEITADMVLQELAKIGFANMADYINVSGSNIVVALDKMTREQAAAVSEITVDEYMEGRGDDAREVKRTKFKLSDKRAALCDIGKHLGMFRESPGGEDAPMPTKVVVELVDARKRDGD